MRVVLILLLWALVACSTPSENPTAENEQLVRSMFGAFNRHDWEAMASHYSDSALFLDPSFGTDYVRQTRIEMVIKYKEMHAMFPDLHDDVVTLVTSGNRVAVEFVATGTQPDGATFRLPISAMFTIENGKIVRDATYYN
ncbi:MAG: nuclear transport factor 2 family protein, partial [Cyclobacteriaceae bacterium]